MKKAAWIFLTCLSMPILPAEATDSAEEMAAICEEAAIRGAEISGVPSEVLRAISIVETGRSSNGRLRPWPWAVNRAGDGRWFADRDQAMRFAESTLAQGRTNVDIGCFQMNYHWHGRRFEDLDEMFDPVAGAIEAGRFLRSLHAETGDWSRAAGHYHSKTPERARNYRAKFDRVLADLRTDPQARLPEVVRGGGKKTRSRTRLSGGPLIITIEPGTFAETRPERDLKAIEDPNKIRQKRISLVP